MNIMDNKISVMFKNLCCSRCKSDFDENSLEILRKEQNLLVIKLSCTTCGKTFGVAYLGISDVEYKENIEENIVLRMKDDLPSISKDDVLDAHKFIKNLDEHWQKYLP